MGEKYFSKTFSIIEKHLSKKSLEKWNKMNLDQKKLLANKLTSRGLFDRWIFADNNDWR
jgi:hypothetical protein